MSKKNALHMPWGIAGNHVVPVDDLRPHRTKNCWCDPEYDEGLVIHNSLDRREEYEEGQRKPS